MEPQKNNVNGKKFYTAGWVYFATYLGGPLAAGYLMKENFKNLGEPELAENALRYGVFATILLLAVILLLPESLMEKVPNTLIPIAYTAIVAGLMAQYQNEKIKTALSSGATKASGWKATGVGLLCLIMMMAVLFGLILLLVELGLME